MASPEADPREWVEQMIACREAGKREGQEENEKLRAVIADMHRTSFPAPPPIHDQMRETVTYGDLIIRKVGNGHIIRRVPLHGGMIETWVVEGGLTEVAKQLTAIQSIDVMGGAAGGGGMTEGMAEALAGHQRASNAAAKSLTTITAGLKSYRP